MPESTLFEEHENEFVVDLSDSTVTSSFSPCSRSNALFYFEVRYRKKISCNEYSEFDEFEICLHSNPKKETIKYVTNVLYYNSRNIFKALDGFVTSVRHSMCSVSSEISIGGTPTAHGREISSGKVILRTKFFIGGHLGTAESILRLKGTLNSRTLFLKHFTDLFESEMLSDLTIQVEDKTLRAHKLILSAHSPVFQRMFQNDFLESKTNTIKIVDATFEVFDCFLKYLYSGELESGCKKYMDDLFKLADKYNVEFLKADCVRKMAHKIDMNNVFELLPLAYDCNEEEIKSNVKSFAVENFAQLGSTSKWKDFVKSYSYIGHDVLAQVYAASKFVPTKPKIR